MTIAPDLGKEPSGKAWHSQSADEVLAQLGTTKAGLVAAEAARRLAADGPNALQEGKRIGPLQMLAGQFKSLIIWILIAAAVVSGVLGEVVDTIAILAIVVLNAAIGFYQEYSADKSIAALQKMTAPQANVLRDGQVVSIPASEIVAGDVLALVAGDLVAADARLVQAASLKCVESALTGESEAVSKEPAALPEGDMPLGDRKNMVFMGTSVAAGTGQAVVVATAMNTELGRIAGLIEGAGAQERTPLQQKLDSFGRVLVWATLGIVGLLFGLGLLRGHRFLEMLMTSVSLAVAAVPEGLPAIVTVSLALGVLRMSRRRALVRKLPAVETLGSATVICTDKTGTLTVGEMTVRALYVAGQHYEVTGEGYGPDGEVRIEGKTAEAQHAAPLLELATILLGSNDAQLVQEEGAWKVTGDPTEGALLAAGAKAGADRERIERELPRHHEIPFDSDRKRSTVIRKMPDGRLRAFINGAPDVLLERCTSLYTSTAVRPMEDEERREIAAQNVALAQQALRVLGSAYRDLDLATPAELTAESVERDLVFVGLSGMHDPPRPEAKEAVAKCGTAGIRVVMITGDHPDTATAIARELGIAADDDIAIAGVELDTISDEQLRQRAAKTAVYARVTAAHKLRIVRAWKANGAVVAMTGDGVNDAPAIKGADIGIAMGKSGTEVTKQAADIIVTDDNFASIVAAVEEGRGIYDNIRKTLQYLLAGNTGELLLMTVCVIAGLATPLLPIHLLWINLVTDGLPALCLATDPIDPDVMKRHPRPRSERITAGGFVGTMVLTGVLTAGVAFAVYMYGLRTETPELARTHAFAVLVFAELLRSFGARSETKPVWRISLFSNISLVIVVAISFGLQVWSHHNAFLGAFLKTSSMPLSDCLLLLAVGAVPLVVLEVVKAARNARATWPTLAGASALLLLGVCMSAQAQAQAPPPAQVAGTGLDTLLREVRARSPTREAALERIAASRSELSAAGRPGDPMISVETDGWGSDPDRGSRMIRYTLEQPIPIPGSLRAEERVARAGIDRASSDLQTALRDLERETIRAYAMLWQMQGELAVVESQRALLEDLAGTALARLGAGADAHHDVIQAQVEGLALQNRATVLEAERASAAAMINALRNRPLSTPLVAIGLGLPDQLADEATLLRSALRDRPVLRSMRAMAREERAMAGLMRVDAWPMLRAGIWYTQDLDMPDSVGVMVAATVPVFGAPRALARAGAAEARAHAADRDRERMEAMIYAEVHGARVRYAAAIERLSLLGDVALPRAEEALLASQSSYRAGMMSFASLIQDRRMLADLRMELVGAQAARLVAWGDLLHAIGADVTAEVAP